MKDVLRPTQHPRPRWDAELLALAGFPHISLGRLSSHLNRSMRMAESLPGKG